MFGILGLNLMKDKLQYCDFNSTTNYDLYSYHQAQVKPHFSSSFTVSSFQLPNKKSVLTSLEQLGVLMI
jgi:hypothetical protein